MALSPVSLVVTDFACVYEFNVILWVFVIPSMPTVTGVVISTVIYSHFRITPLSPCLRDLGSALTEHGILGGIHASV